MSLKTQKLRSYDFFFFLFSKIVFKSRKSAPGPPGGTRGSQQQGSQQVSGPTWGSAGQSVGGISMTQWLVLFRRRRSKKKTQTRYGTGDWPDWYGSFFQPAGSSCHFTIVLARGVLLNFFKKIELIFTTKLPKSADAPSLPPSFHPYLYLSRCDTRSRGGLQ